MGRAIVSGLTLVTIVIVVSMVVVYFRRRQSKETAQERGWAINGDLNRRQEQAIIAQLDQATAIFRQLLIPPTDLSGDMTILSDMDRLAIRDWLYEYQRSMTGSSTTKKGIERS